MRLAATRMNQVGLPYLHGRADKDPTAYCSSTRFPTPIKASFRQRNRRSSAIDEGIEDSNAAVALLHYICTRIAERLAGESASPAADSHGMHRLNISHYRISVLWNAFPYLRCRLVDRRYTYQAAARMYPYTIFRVRLAHHGFALHGVKLDKDRVEVVSHQFCNGHVSSHLVLSIFCRALRSSHLNLPPSTSCSTPAI